MGRGKKSKEERKEGREEGEMIGKTGSFIGDQTKNS